MREKHGIDAMRIDREPRPVMQAQRFEPLKQTAVHKELLIGVFHQVFRASNGSCAAEER